MKQYITAEQAIRVLPDGDDIHTFINGGFGLCGADWSRGDIIQELQSSDKIELTGKMARGMGHGIVCYNDTARKQSELLFVETNEERLDDLEKEIAGGNAE